MFDTLCTYPLPSDLFTLAIHPTSPLLASGLASGHVQLNRLPPAHATPPAPPASSKKSKKPPPSINEISTAWSTRRHKTSCRSLAFSQPDGAHLFSTGTDSLVKLADTETGRVTSKIAVPHHSSHSDTTPYKKSTQDSPTLLHVFDPHCLLLATDSAALHLYDIREQTTSTSSSSSALSMSSKPQQTYRPHADYVTSITSLPEPSASIHPPSTTNGTNNNNNATSSTLLPSTQFVSTGAATVAITDIRRGVLVQSAEQDEELLSSTLCGDRVVVGGERGVLRLWDVGKWDDSEVEVAVVPRRRGIVGGATADVLSAFSKNGGMGDDEEDSMVAVGMDDGVIRFVDLEARKGRVMVGEEVKHDVAGEGVSGLGFLGGDAIGRRMVSGGGSVVKIWGERVDGVDDGEEEEEDREVIAANGKRRMENGGDDDDDDREDSDDEEDDDDEDEGPKRRRKKRRKGGKINGLGQKQVMKFKGLD